jgi:maleylpyruvate isomerase
MSQKADPHLKLYTYFRSSAAFRARIMLNLKGLKPEQAFVHLVKNEQQAASYLKLNPQGLVPALEHDGFLIAQSLAMAEYLEEVFPEPPLLPKDAKGRARVREIAYAIACDIHPINNLRVRRYLAKEMKQSEADVLAWQIHWMDLGFTAIETMLAGSKETGRFVHGDTPTLADVCLIPQMANARGAKMDLNKYPTLKRIEKAAYELKPFNDALPANQPDAE